VAAGRAYEPPNDCKRENKDQPKFANAMADAGA